MGGFRRGRGRPTPGMTAARGSQGGRAQGGNPVGAEEAAPGPGVPGQLWLIHLFPGAGGQVRAGGRESPVQGPSGVPGCCRTARPTTGSTPVRQAPGALNSESQFAHLYNGNTPGRTGAGLGQHCSVKHCPPELCELSSLWEGASEACFSPGPPVRWSKHSCLHLAGRSKGHTEPLGRMEHPQLCPPTEVLLTLLRAHVRDLRACPFPSSPPPGPGWGWISDPLQPGRRTNGSGHCRGWTGGRWSAGPPHQWPGPRTHSGLGAQRWRSLWRSVDP